MSWSRVKFSSSFETGMCVEMPWTRTLRNAVTFLNAATLSFSGTPIRPMPVSTLKLIATVPIRSNASASSTTEIVGMNLPSMIADRSLGKAGPRIMIGWFNPAVRSARASSRLAMPKYLTSFARVSATPTRPCPYAFAFTTASISAEPMRSRTTPALCRKALRSISAQQRWVSDILFRRGDMRLAQIHRLERRQNKRAIRLASKLRQNSSGRMTNAHALKLRQRFDSKDWRPRSQTVESDSQFGFRVKDGRNGQGTAANLRQKKRLPAGVTHDGVFD